jgi:hypothetical protein
MENKYVIHLGDSDTIKITDIHWFIPEHNCWENEALFVTRNDARTLCKVCLKPVVRGSASLPSSDVTEDTE